MTFSNSGSSLLARPDPFSAAKIKTLQAEIPGSEFAGMQAAGEIFSNAASGMENPKGFGWAQGAFIFI